MSILKNSISKITAYLCDAGNDFIQSKNLDVVVETGKNFWRKILEFVKGMRSSALMEDLTLDTWKFIHSNWRKSRVHGSRCWQVHECIGKKFMKCASD